MCVPRTRLAISATSAKLCSAGPQSGYVFPLWVTGVSSIATITCARSSVATGDQRELASHGIFMTPWRIERATQSNHSLKIVALRCATGTADQSKTCSESQWLILAGLFALGREFHCDMLATISTPASLAACAQSPRAGTSQGRDGEE